MLQAVSSEEAVGHRIIAHISTERGIRTKFHNGTLQSVVPGSLERDGFTEKEELGMVQKVSLLHCRLVAEPNTKDPIGFSRFLTPLLKIFFPEKNGARSVQIEIALLIGPLYFLLFLNDLQIGKPSQDHFLHTIFDVFRPKNNLYLRQIGADQSDRANGMRDVTDVDAVP